MHTAANAILGVLVVAIFSFAGCGDSKDERGADGNAAASDTSSDKRENQDKNQQSSGAREAATRSAPNGASAAENPGQRTTPTERPSEASPAAESPPAPVLEDVVRTPATAAEAAAAIDLRKVPVPDDVENPGLSIASVYFTTQAKEKAVFDSIAKFFADNEWKLYHDVHSNPGSISAGYARDGFRVSVSAFSNADRTTVIVNNLSNVNLARLPVPDGAEDWDSFGDVADFLTDAGVDETRAAVHELLLADGWQPYGGDADTRDYKQNAVLLHARVLSPPTQPGKTAINYTSEQLSADLPAPPAATRVDYSDRPTQIYVEAPLTPDDVVSYYRETLAPAGWKATTENPIVDRYEQMLIFRNPDKDMLTLNMREIEDEKLTRYSLEFQSAEEIAKLDEQLDKLAEEKKKEREAELNRPKAKATIALPAAAKDVEAEENRIEFKLATGEGKAAADAIVQALEADGWKAETTLADPMAGQVALQKGDHAISVVYIDPGVIPAQVTAIGIGIDIGIDIALEQKK